MHIFHFYLHIIQRNFILIGSINYSCSNNNNVEGNVFTHNLIRSIHYQLIFLRGRLLLLSYLGFKLLLKSKNIVPVFVKVEERNEPIL